MSVELQSTLSTIIQQLASFFGMTTEAIMQNMPVWLANYGWYIVIGDITFNLIAGLVLGAIILGGIYGITEGRIQSKTFHTLILFAVLLVGLAGVVFPLIRCYIAPEFYGLDNLLRILSAG